MKLFAKSVLVVDDDPELVLVLKSLLARHHFLVMSAQDGAEALEMARTHRPALILLDAAMPRLDGYGVCAALQSDPGTSDIPVLMLSGLSSNEEVVRGLDSGADSYVSKPFNSGELLARIRSLIDRSRFFAYTSGRQL